jgi:hypothetical protein
LAASFHTQIKPTIAIGKSLAALPPNSILAFGTDFARSCCSLVIHSLFESRGRLLFGQQMNSRCFAVRDGNHEPNGQLTHPLGELPFSYAHLGIEGTIKMKTLWTFALIVAALGITGCDVDIEDPSPAPAALTPAPATQPDSGVVVDIDTPAENRLERREERRENLRDAIDGVDVQVGNGQVKVDVDGD